MISSFEAELIIINEKQIKRLQRREQRQLERSQILSTLQITSSATNEEKTIHSYQPNYFTFLSDDIKLNILYKLYCILDLIRLSITCISFYNLCNDDSIWYKLFLCLFESNTKRKIRQDIAQYMWRYKAPIQLQYKDWKDLTRQILFVPIRSHFSNHPSNDIRSLEKYEILETIFPSNCRTCIARLKNDENKLVIMYQQQRNLCQEEIYVYTQLKHPHLSPYIETIDENQNSPFVWMIKQYTPTISLLKLIKERKSTSNDKGVSKESPICTIDEISNICQQICLLLIHLHRNQIILRNICSDNIFLTSDMKVIIQSIPEPAVLNKSKNVILTQEIPQYYDVLWLPPEVFSSSKYDEKADIWALGIVVYEMLFGFPPHYSESATQIILEIYRNGAPKLDDTWPGDLVEFYSSCVFYDPKNRLSALELFFLPFIHSNL